MTKRRLMKIRKEALKEREMIQHNNIWQQSECLLKYINYTLELTQHLIDQQLIKEK